ncbi:MAG TPA: hypothetical protein VFU43_19680 [Streptosporangiaceae bacterium]|nr:hypothetical protein [Streptosporangiaceae bacterium]
MTAVPAAVLVVPNTMSYVVAQAIRDLGLPAGDAAAMVRAAGLALPGLLLAVPLTAVLARRVPASLVLIAGLGVVLAAEVAAEFTGSLPVLGPVPAVGVLRFVEGLGAGAVLPATLVLAWRHDGARGRALTALWAGSLAAALMLAVPLALFGIPMAGVPDPAAPGVVPAGQFPGEWRAALQPYPWLAALALVVAAVCGPLPARAALPALRHAERTQLLLPLAPAAGFALLAVVSAYGWSPGGQLIVAGVGLAGLAGLGVVGSRDATAGTPLGFAVVALTTGVLAMPLAAPLAGLVSTYLGPRGVPLTPYLGAAAAALAGALLAARLRTTAARAAVLAGHGLAVVAILVLLATDTMAGAWSRPWPVLAPLVLLGAGLGMALAASLRAAGLGAALFGLTLCFPGVLCGYLVIGPLQVHRVDAAIDAGGGARDVVVALTAAFRGWLIVAGVITVLLAGVAAVAGRLSGAAVLPAGRAPEPAGGAGEPAGGGGEPADGAGESADEVGESSGNTAVAG